MFHSQWRKIFLACLGMLFFLSGCGQRVKDTIKAIDTTHLAKPAPCSRIVMLPFADYSSGRHLDDSLRRQIKVQTAIAHALASEGYFMPMEEDVVQYLIDLGVITLIKGPAMETKRSSMSFYRELGNGWSDEMQTELRAILARNQLLSKPEERLKINKVGLSKGIIRQIGRYFGADYILRGRIVEYEIREGQELNPFQQGILPFFFDVTSNAIFGVAKSENYDLWHDLAIGGTMGAALGSQANTPFNRPTDSTTIVGSNPRFAQMVTKTSGGFEHAATWNGAVWGAAGMTAAFLASKGGHIPKAVVQISLALQDPNTGQIVWSNRVEKAVEPVTMWADNTDRTQLDRAVEEAAKTLLKDLAKNLAINSKCGQVTQDSLFTQAPTQQPVIHKSYPTQDIKNPKALANDPANWGS